MLCNIEEEHLLKERLKIVNKQELVSAVAKASGLKNAEAEAAIEAVFDSITDALQKGSEVRFLGFGTFSVVHRPASEGRNPRTGEKIQVPEKKVVRFRPGKKLKDVVTV